MIVTEEERVSVLCPYDFESFITITMWYSIGDSGGALVAENSVIGIVAWGHDGCGGGMYPDVYVRVSYIYEWVHNTISQ